MADNEREITFLASLPPIQSAIKVSGEGTTRLLLEVPKSELANVLAMAALDGVVFRVTIQVEQDEPSRSKHIKTDGERAF